MADNPPAAVATWVSEHKSVCADFLRLYRRCQALAQKTADNGFYGTSTIADGTDVDINEVRLAHNLVVLAIKTFGEGSQVGAADRIGTVYRMLRSEGV